MNFKSLLKTMSRESKERSLRDFERTVKELWEDGKIKRPVHLSGGNEGELVSLFELIKPEDYVFSTHRNHYHYLLKGGDDLKLIEEMLGRETGICGGKSGSMCTTDRKINFFSTGIIGGGCGIAVGVAWALRERGSKANVFCFIGDSVVETGHFYSAWVYACCEKLPIVFVIEDNERATCTPSVARTGMDYPSSFASYGAITHKIMYYRYKPKYPHVGSGTYVAF